MNKKVFLIIMVLALGIVLTGCEGLFTESDGSGELALSIADAPVNDIEEVNVTIDQVRVHSEEEGWLDLEDFDDTENGQRTFNLLDLRFDEELLGQDMLPEGEYTKIRLMVAANDGEADNPERGDSYIVDKNGDEYGLFIPGGQQAGLQINHNFTIEEGTITRLVLDNDVRDILNDNVPNGYMLRRTAIEVIDQTVSGDIEGRVVELVDGEEGDAITDQDVIVEAINEDDEVAADTVATTEPTYERDEDGEIITDEDGNKVVDKLAGSFRLRGLHEDGTYSVNAYIEDEDGNKIYEAEEIIEGVEVEAGEVTELEDNLVIDRSSTE